MATELKETEKTRKIRLLNDVHRKLIPASRTVITSGVAALDPFHIACLIDAIRSFDEFVEDNDPYGEHDFGRIEYKGEVFYFKVDYYAKNDLTRGSENPADCRMTTRLLTLLKASEY